MSSAPSNPPSPDPVAASVPATPAVDAARRDSLRFLDGLRGIAALFVVIGHARGLLWEGYSTGYLKHPETYSLFNKLIMYALSIFRVGQWAVLFFFVLSGFVIHLNYSRSLRASGDAKFDFKTFLIKRCRRLYPPLLLAMLLTWVFDFIGSSQHFDIYFKSTPYDAINLSFDPQHGPVSLFGNLLFLMTARLWFVYDLVWTSSAIHFSWASLDVPVWGSNGALWSLHYEWWFYMLYPIFWWISRRSIAQATGVMFGLFVASFFPSLWCGLFFKETFSMMICWWMGVLLADVYTGRIKADFGRLSWLMLALFIMIPLMNIKSIPLDSRSREFIADALMAVVFTGVISLCLWLQSRGWSLWMLDRLKPLGDMSYSLYVTHLPLIVLLSGWLMSQSPDSRLPAHFGWVAVGLVAVFPLAYLSYLTVEKPFMGKKK